MDDEHIDLPVQDFNPVDDRIEEIWPMHMWDGSWTILFRGSRLYPYNRWHGVPGEDGFQAKFKTQAEAVHAVEQLVLETA